MSTATAVELIAPASVFTLRTTSYNNELEKLISAVDHESFQKAFAAPISQYEQLVKANTLTIPRLLEIAPIGTVDHSPFLYDDLMCAMCSSVVLAAIANAWITPLDKRHLIKKE